MQSNLNYDVISAVPIMFQFSIRILQIWMIVNTFDGFMPININSLMSIIKTFKFRNQYENKPQQYGQYKNQYGQYGNAFNRGSNQSNFRPNYVTVNASQINPRSYQIQIYQFLQQYQLFGYRPNAGQGYQPQPQVPLKQITGPPNVLGSLQQPRPSLSQDRQPFQPFLFIQ